MKHEQFILSSMAQIGALRKLVLSAVALRLIEDPDPMRALAMLGTLVTGSETLPTDTGGALDPATSDLLAAMTDEHLETLVDELREHLSIAT